MNYGPEGASVFNNNLKIIPAKRLGIPKEVTLLLKSCNLSFEYKSSRTIEKNTLNYYTFGFYLLHTYVLFRPYVRKLL